MPFLRILLVEDEFLIALDLEQILQEAGHLVVGIASTASDALRLANETNPQLAFVDVDLRDGRTGFDVAKRLSEGGKILPVFLTANAAAAELECGAGIVTKPYNPDEVVQAAQYLAEGILTPPPSCALPRTLRLSEATQRLFSAQHQ